jgi:hypothetical protein
MPWARRALAALPVTIVTGTSERIEFLLAACRHPAGNHRFEAAASIQLTGLGPGASNVSCHGFSGPVTPVRALRWGALKAVYR